MKRIVPSVCPQDGLSLRRQLQLIKPLKAFNCLSLIAASKLTNRPILTCRYVLESLELALQEETMGRHRGHDPQVLIRFDHKGSGKHDVPGDISSELPEQEERLCVNP